MARMLTGDANENACATGRRKPARLAVATHKKDLDDALGGSEFSKYLKTAAKSAEQAPAPPLAQSALGYGDGPMPYGAAVREHSRQPRASARGREAAGSATTAFDRAFAATENAMLSQTDLALQTAATADTSETVTTLQNSTVRDRAANMALKEEIRA